MKTKLRGLNALIAKRLLKPLKTSEAMIFKTPFTGKAMPNFSLPGELDAIPAKQRTKEETQQKLSPILTIFKQKYER